MENTALLQMFLYQQFYFIFLITSLRYVLLCVCVCDYDEYFCFIKPSKILFDLTVAICKVQEFSFPCKNHGILFHKHTNKEKLLFLCTLAALFSPLKDRILWVSCNLYENEMLSSSFIYVMQSQCSPLQNLKHTQ